MCFPSSRSGGPFPVSNDTPADMFFTLLGEETRIACALFRSDAARVPVAPGGGRGACGRPGRSIRPKGFLPGVCQGHSATRRSRADQGKKGTHEQARGRGSFRSFQKEEDALYPSRIAIVTSPTGAAVRDVVKVSKGRFPQCSLAVVPAVVQGSTAVEEIVRGLEGPDPCQGSTPSCWSGEAEAVTT